MISAVGRPSTGVGGDRGWIDCGEIAVVETEQHRLARRPVMQKHVGVPGHLPDFGLSRGRFDIDFANSLEAVEGIEARRATLRHWWHSSQGITPRRLYPDNVCTEQRKQVSGKGTLYPPARFNNGKAA